jgi:three-Cys-motif partner protein
MKLTGELKTIDFFLNFPIMDMNRNILRRDHSSVSEEQKLRMDFFWGDRSWENVAWETSSDMFGDPLKTTNEAIVEAFQKRLKEVAGFKYVPEPLPMRNKTNAVVYYLFFASNSEAGDKIARHLFKNYKEGAKS